MKSLLTANIGNFPKVGEEKDHQRFRRGYGHYERKEISAHAFRDVQQSVIHELIREQENCFVDEVTDGLVCWDDPISHFCNNIAGFERTGLNRYFGTNFYYRKPVLTSKPHIKAPIISAEYLYAKSLSRKTVRAILTGPYTLASHTGSELKSFSKLESRMELFTDMLSREVKALAGAGATLIQIDEPSLAAKPSDFKLVQKSLEKISLNKGTAKIVLALYFSPLTPLWGNLQSLPVDGLNLDFTFDGTALFKKMESAPGQKEVGLGLVNALNTKIETVSELSELVKRWQDISPASTTWITPSTGLEFLPRASAIAKLTLLNAVKAAVQ